MRFFLTWLWWWFIFGRSRYGKSTFISMPASDHSPFATHLELFRGFHGFLRGFFHEMLDDVFQGGHACSLADLSELDESVFCEPPFSQFHAQIDVFHHDSFECTGPAPMPSGRDHIVQCFECSLGLSHRFQLFGSFQRIFRFHEEPRLVTEHRSRVSRTSTSIFSTRVLLFVVQMRFCSVRDVCASAGRLCPSCGPSGFGSWFRFPFDWRTDPFRSIF